MSKLNEKKINEVLNQKGKELLGEAFEGVGGVVCTPAINKLEAGFTSFKKEEKLEEESYYDKVPIPAQVNRFLKRFVGALKDGNLNRNKQIAVLMQVVKALGLSPQELVRYTQKVKRSI